MEKIWGIILGVLFLPVFTLAAEVVDINTASLAQLETLTGIGPVKAQAIIDARPYSSLDDLDRAKGIGASTLQKIKTQGLACVGCASTQTTTEVVTKLVTELVTEHITEQTYPVGIFINEVLASPKGADETDEYIELFNSNNFEADISSWQIQDKTGTPTTYIIPMGTKITANDFKVFYRPETKIMLNNDEDGLNLLKPDKTLADTVDFSKVPTGQSYNRTVPSWVWSIFLTPGAKNIVAVADTIKHATTAALMGSVLPKDEKNDNNIIETNQDNKSNPWFLFFTVLAATIILAITALIIKVKLIKPGT